MMIVWYKTSSFEGKFSENWYTSFHTSLEITMIFCVNCQSSRRYSVFEEIYLKRARPTIDASCTIVVPTGDFDKKKLQTFSQSED